MNAIPPLERSRLFGAANPDARVHSPAFVMALVGGKVCGWQPWFLKLNHELRFFEY